jgi:hypothetical protein
MSRGAVTSAALFVSPHLDSWHRQPAILDAVKKKEKDAECYGIDCLTTGIRTTA